jgi:hypothetical protein
MEIEIFDFGVSNPDIYPSFENSEMHSFESIVEESTTKSFE